MIIIFSSFSVSLFPCIFFFNRRRHTKNKCACFLGFPRGGTEKGLINKLARAGAPSAPLQAAGLTSVKERLAGYIALGLCKLVPEALVMLVVDRAGRRPLVLGSSAAVSAAIFALALCFAVKGSPGASRSAQEAGREGGAG